MKIKSVRVNRRKKSFEVKTSKGALEFPFSKLDSNLQRSRVLKAYVDKELGNEAITFQLNSGKEGSIHLDQILEYNKDRDYLREILLYKLSVKAQKVLKEKSISKREVIRRLQTSPTQFYRLIDQTNTRKTVDQMIRLLAALDYTVDIIFKKAA